MAPGDAGAPEAAPGAQLWDTGSPTGHFLIF